MRTTAVAIAAKAQGLHFKEEIEKIMSSWGCPHEIDGKCARINNLPCDPGMKGCVLFGRFVWADDSKNRPPKAEHGNKPDSPLEEQKP